MTGCRLNVQDANKAVEVQGAQVGRVDAELRAVNKRGCVAEGVWAERVQAERVWRGHCQT
jgi:hypothetical protein